LNLVLSLLGQPLDIGNDLGSAVNQLLGLAEVQQCRNATTLPHLDQAERIFAVRQRAPGNFQLHVQLEQAEVRGGHIAHESRDNGLSILFRKEQISSGRFGRAPQAAPGVNFKGEQVKQNAAECSFLFEAERELEGAIRGIAQGCDVGAEVDAGELVGSRDTQNGTRGDHSYHRITKIVVLSERGADQFLQPLVFENLKPFEIGERGGVGRRRVTAAAPKNICGWIKGLR
jgi:hypothetical protein